MSDTHGLVSTADLEAELALVRTLARVRLAASEIKGVEWSAIFSLLGAIDELSRRLTALAYVGEIDLAIPAVVPVGFVDEGAG